MKQEIRDVHEALEGLGYIAGREIATAVYLSWQMKKPLLVEGDAGVGKTELAKVIAAWLDTDLIRLQCYEGLDVNTAVYEWNYPRQLLQLKMSERDGRDTDELEDLIFTRKYLLERPLLKAITRREGPAVLLIDEIDRADDGFEAFLLEVLSDCLSTLTEVYGIRMKATGKRYFISGRK